MPGDERRRTNPVAVAAADLSGPRIVAAAIGLTLAAVLSPIAVAMVASANAWLWQSAVTSALVGLLVLAPAGLGIAAALVGLRRIAALAGQAGYESEHAVLRVLDW